MRRRNVLAGISLGCVGVVSGCLSEDSGSGETQSTAADSETQSTAAAGDADIGNVAVEMPDEVEIGAELTIEITAENAGGADGTLETAVQIDVPGQETRTVDIELQIAGGSSASEQVTVSSSVLGDVVVTIEEYNTTMRTTVVPLQLSFGTYVDVENVPEITVSKPQVSNYYAYESPEGTFRVTTGSDTKFMFAEVRVRNPSSETANFPGSTTFTAQIGERSYDPIPSEAVGTATFVDPLVGKELGSFSLPSGAIQEDSEITQFENRILLFEVRIDELSTGIEIQTEWSVGPSTGETAVRWSE